MLPLEASNASPAIPPVPLGIPVLLAKEISEAKLIPLTRGLQATVDAGDFDWLSQWRWFALRGRSGFYAARWESSTGKRRMISMHREILCAPANKEVDHRNHDTLLNLRTNLRLASDAESARNRRLQCNSTKGLKGVSFYLARGKFRAQIEFSGRTKHLGYFNTAQEAAACYDIWASARFKDFALTNKMLTARRAATNGR